MPTNRSVLSTMCMSIAAGFTVGALFLPLVGAVWARVPTMTVMLAVWMAMTQSRARAIRLVPFWIVFFSCLALATR